MLAPCCVGQIVLYFGGIIAGQTFLLLDFARISGIIQMVWYNMSFYAECCCLPVAESQILRLDSS